MVVADITALFSRWDFGCITDIMGCGVMCGPTGALAICLISPFHLDWNIVKFWGDSRRTGHFPMLCLILLDYSSLNAKQF